MPVETLFKLFDDMVEKIGQAEVARRTGYSRSAVCCVHKRTYRGDPGKLLEAVRSAFDTSTVHCPILGDITYARCIEEKNRPFAAVNPVRVRLAKTCRVCNGGDK